MFFCVLLWILLPLHTSSTSSRHERDKSQPVVHLIQPPLLTAAESHSQQRMGARFLCGFNKYYSPAALISRPSRGRPSSEQSTSARSLRPPQVHSTHQATNNPPTKLLIEQTSDSLSLQAITLEPCPCNTILAAPAAAAAALWLQVHKYKSTRPLNAIRTRGIEPGLVGCQWPGRQAGKPTHSILNLCKCHEATSSHEKCVIYSLHSSSSSWGFSQNSPAHLVQSTRKEDVTSDEFAGELIVRRRRHTCTESSSQGRRDPGIASRSKNWISN